MSMGIGEINRYRLLNTRPFFAAYCCKCKSE